MSGIANTKRGFTLVELMVVIIVIAILAAITIVSYNGVQERAREAKIETDLAYIEKAVEAARLSEGKLMREITGSDATASECIWRSGVESLSELPKSNPCWTEYEQALGLISEASKMDIRGLVDPYGQPYFIDENEQTTDCQQDDIGTYPYPYQPGWEHPERRVEINNYRTDCW